MGGFAGRGGPTISPHLPTTLPSTGALERFGAGGDRALSAKSSVEGGARVGVRGVLKARAPASFQRRGTEFREGKGRAQGLPVLAPNPPRRGLCSMLGVSRSQSRARASRKLASRVGVGGEQTGKEPRCGLHRWSATLRGALRPGQPQSTGFTDHHLGQPGGSSWHGQELAGEEHRGFWLLQAEMAG